MAGQNAEETWHQAVFVRASPAEFEPPVALPVRRLRHATTDANAVCIATATGYRFKFKHKAGLEQNLCWFGFDPSPEDQDAVYDRNAVHRRRWSDQEAAVPEDDSKPRDSATEEDHELSQFAPSLVIGGSRYGTVAFSATFEDVLDAYRGLVGREIMFRCGGTLAYKQERCHVILVCPKEAAGLDEDTFPDLMKMNDSPNTPYVRGQHQHEGMWRCASVPAFDQPTTCWQWEELSFAFLQPGSAEALVIPGEKITPRLCRLTKPNAKPVDGRHRDISLTEARVDFIFRVICECFPINGEDKPLTWPKSFQELYEEVWDEDALEAARNKEARTIKRLVNAPLDGIGYDFNVINRMNKSLHLNDDTKLWWPKEHKAGAVRYMLYYLKLVNFK